MAQRGKPLDVRTLQLLLRVARDSSIREAARQVGVSPNTVRKYARPTKSH